MSYFQTLYGTDDVNTTFKERRMITHVIVELKYPVEDKYFHGTDECPKPYRRKEE